MYRKNHNPSNKITWIYHNGECSVRIGLDYLKLFASLEHINSKYEKVEDDWGYAPTLYSFDGQWHVSWVSCEELDVLISYEADSPQEAILKAFENYELDIIRLRKNEKQ